MFLPSLDNQILQKAGEHDLIPIFAPQQSLVQVQKLLHQMIRNREVDQELWATYVKLATEQSAHVQKGSSF